MGRRQKPRYNESHRYRLDDDEAKWLGLEVNKTKRYRLKKDQEDKLLGSYESNLKRLFFDIETSRYLVESWRIGSKVNLNYQDVVELPKIICISYKWEGEDKVHHLHWDKNQCDKKMIQKFSKVLNEADEVVAHNGDNFDIKTIRGRAVYHRVKMKPKYRSYDTLKKSRASFNLPNHKLDTIAKYLGVGAKYQHRGLVMWQEVMAGDKEALKEMIEYCDIDVVILESVYRVMKNYTSLNTHEGVHDGGMKYSCKSCGEDEMLNLNKNNVTPSGTIKREMKCLSCGYTYDISNRSYMYFLEGRK